MLADLDAAAWSRFGEDTCRQLARAVLNQVLNTIYTPRWRRRNEFLQRVVVRGGEPLDVSALELEPRTIHAFAPVARRRPRRKWTLGNLLEIHWFGALCLVDLLTSIEAHRLHLVPRVRLNPGRRRGHTFLEDELRAIVDGPSVDPLFHDRDRAIVLAHFGWDGKGVRTSASLGKRYHVTGAWAGAVCERARAAIRGRGAAAVVLARTLERVAREIPGRAEAIEATLQREKLTRGRFQLAGLRVAAELLGDGWEFEDGGSRFPGTVFPRGRGRLARRIAWLTRRETLRHGAARLSVIIAQLSVRGRPAPDEKTIRGLLVALPEFQWLDEEHGWFWLAPKKRNPVVYSVRRVLAVAGRIDIDTLAASVARVRLDPLSLPRPVLAAICRQIPGCAVKGRILIADPPIPYQKVLGRMEAEMVRCLLKHGPVVSHRELVDACGDVGMNRDGASSKIRTMPTIVRLSRDRYALVGTERSSMRRGR